MNHYSFLKRNIYLMMFSFFSIVSCFFCLVFSRFCQNDPVNGGWGGGTWLLAPSVSRRKRKCKRPSSRSSSPSLILSQEWVGWGGSTAIQLLPAPSLTSKTCEIYLEQQNGCSTSPCNSILKRAVQSLKTKPLQFLNKPFHVRSMWLTSVQFIT